MLYLYVEDQSDAKHMRFEPWKHCVESWFIYNICCFVDHAKIKLDMGLIVAELEMCSSTLSSINAQFIIQQAGILGSSTTQVRHNLSQTGNTPRLTRQFSEF